MNFLIGKYKLSIGLNTLVATATAVLLLIFFLVAFSSLQPKFNELKQIKKDIAQKENEIELNQNYFVKLKDAKTELNKYQAELSKIDSALPDDPLVPDFFDYLQNVASQSGLLIQNSGSFVTSLSSAFPALQETSFNLSLTGSYGSFKTFLTTLEKSARVIEVNSMSFAPANAPGTSKKTNDFFSFALIVKTYSY